MKSLLACFAMTGAVAMALSLTGGGAPDSHQLYMAIRNNDLATLRKLIGESKLTAKDADGNSPLMYAAAVGSPESLRLLLDAGADPNQANKVGGTALMWCAGDAAKVRILLDKGADVRAKTKLGRTALEIAVYYDNSGEAARLLIDRGADIDALDAPHVSILENAAGSNNLPATRLLLEKGANVNSTDAGGFTPLLAATATGSHSGPVVKLLLQHGAKANLKCASNLGGVLHGPIRLGSLTPLHQAAAADYEATKALVDAGADVNATDVRIDTPLVDAVATDHPDLRTIKLLLAKGAAPEPAIPWAQRYNDPAVLALLGQTARDPESMTSTAHVSTTHARICASIAKALATSQPTAAQFQKTGGCVSCHAQNLNGQAVAQVKPLGIAANYKLEADQAAINAREQNNLRNDLMLLQDPPSGDDGMSQALAHMGAAKVPAGPVTDTLMHYIVAGQRSPGYWPNPGAVRPPLEDGDFTITARAIRVMRKYPIPGIQPELNERTARAAKWLRHAEPTSTEDRNSQILGLAWNHEKVPANRLHQLLARQRKDGGWGQTDHLPSDAYATGESLWALHEAGVPTSDPRFKRGVRFLLSSQQKDGTWHVATRSLAFQPYFQSGFPYGHDQWISQAGTAMATIALALAAK